MYRDPARQGKRVNIRRVEGGERNEGTQEPQAKKRRRGGEGPRGGHGVTLVWTVARSSESLGEF